MRERFMQVLDYEPETGVLTWRVRTSNRVKIGSVAQCPSGNGYLKVRVDGVLYYAHRVAYTIANGDIPDGKEIDHINGCGRDNRLVNLRLVDSSGNKKNQKIRHNNRSGVIGVCWHAAASKWTATIGHDRTYTYLGLFEDFTAAVSARKAAEKEFGYHENHGSKR
jgi:HNH endonuclease